LDISEIRKLQKIVQDAQFSIAQLKEVFMMEQQEVSDECASLIVPVKKQVQISCQLVKSMPKGESIPPNQQGTF